MPLKPTLSWEVPRNSEEIGVVTRQSIIHQWAVPQIYPASEELGYEINDETTTYIVECHRKKFKVTIQEVV